MELHITAKQKNFSDLRYESDLVLVLLGNVFTRYFFWFCLLDFSGIRSNTNHPTTEQLFAVSIHILDLIKLKSMDYEFKFE